MLATRAAVTEPFTDFSVEHVSRLSLTRLYNSIDVSIVAGAPPGPFGRGWHHDWEATLSCVGSVCTVSQGLLPGFQFMPSGTAPSLDGLETWAIYTTHANAVLRGDSRNLLVRKPDGTWIMFQTDGSEVHFRTVCDACSGAPDPRCAAPEAGGVARLVKLVDPRGNAVAVSYDRPNGLLLGLRDDLGHALELKGAQACGDGLATELRYGGAVVARYGYSGLDLASATDADGVPLRTYGYYAGSSGRLQVVKNQAGDPVAEFSYDATWRAVGLVDHASSVSIDYDAPNGVAVTDYFRGKDGDTSSVSVRTLNHDGRVTSISDGCACGAPRTFQWTNRRLTCSLDANGLSTIQEFDGLGRLARSVDVAMNTCVMPAQIPSVGGRDRRYGYGVVKPIAQGVSLDLDAVTSEERSSTLSPQTLVGEAFDYSQAPNPTLDPPGYLCADVPLPAGSVVCRQVTRGFVSGPDDVKSLERHAVFFSYDLRGRLARKVGPINLDAPSPTDVTPVEERTYWSDSETLARRGRLHQLKRYAGPATAPLVTIYDYDDYGAYLVMGPDGRRTTIIKDGRGRPTFVVAPDGTRETRYYDGLAPRLQIAPGGAATRYRHDLRGRVERIEWLSSDPEATGPSPTLGWSEQHAYDAAGNRVHSERRDRLGAQTWQQDRGYDVQHRVVWESNPEAPSMGMSWSYDASGFLTVSKDEEDRASVFTPDGLGRVQRVRRTGPGGQGLDVASYGYAPNSDALSDVVATNGSMYQGRDQTNYVQDDFGRVARVSSVVGSRYFGYDARGNLLAKVSDVTIRFAYDGLDRLVSLTGPGISYAYGYDAPPYQGHLTSITETDRTVSFTYDAAGRLATESVQEAGVAAPLVTRYDYGSDGALRQVTYPSGLGLRYDRDPATREVVRVVNATSGTLYADLVTHYPGGPLQSLAFGNGRTLLQSFNRRHEPAAISSGPLALGYTMSPAGDVATIADTSLTLTGCPRDTARDFTYDFLDRLTDSPGWLGYGLDEEGNRISESVEGRSATFTYYGNVSGSLNRLATRVEAGKNTHQFSYDTRNNLAGIGRFDAAGVGQTAGLCLVHDTLDRMVLVAAKSGAVTSATECVNETQVAQALVRFKYDSRNRRIARQDAATGQWTYIVPDASGNPLSELALVNGNWVKVRDYVWLDGKPLAQIEYPGPAGSTEGYVYYLHLDHVGLPRAMTNQAGQLVWNTFPKPYGDIAEKTSTDPLSGKVVVTNLRLPGQYDERLLGSVGLQGPYYNWNRWYLPGVGRYLELDPIASRGGANGPFGPDWYNYGNGNPLKYTDPWGLYGTNDCSYYQQRCLESGGKYYCDQAQYWCNWFGDWFGRPPDPDPGRDDDYEGWTRCTRQCLQDCDRDENKNQNSCPPTPDDRKGPWDPRSKSYECHKKCYTYCAAWGVGRRDKPPY